MTDNNWLAFHFYYAGDRDHLLRTAIRPLVASLAARGAIDSAFFIRFGLGGPHIRLRLRVVPGQAAVVRDAVTQAAAAFFAAHPSSHRADEDQIRRVSQSILASDANETDDRIYPDNSVHEHAFHPEIERYGGAALLDHALDFFTISSVHALCFLAEHGDAPRSRQLPMILRLLFRQAWGLAWDADSLLAILAYADTYWGHTMQPILARGDHLFDARPTVYCQILRQERDVLEAGVPSTTGLPPLAEAAACLARALRLVEPAQRLSIAMSQLHMTANRLGLGNADECYLGRLLCRTVDAVGRDAPWIRLGASPERAQAPAHDLRALVPRILATLELPAD